MHRDEMFLAAVATIYYTILVLFAYVWLQVAEMKQVVEQKQVVVAQSKQDCEQLLVQIVQDKRIADEQEKQVRAVAASVH